MIVVAARRGQDLYLQVDETTGVIIAVGTGRELDLTTHELHLATLDGASDLLDTYGWRAAYIPICGVALPRTQLAALARAVDTGDTCRRNDIIRNAGRGAAA